MARDPVLVNALIREFVDALAPPAAPPDVGRAPRAAAKRALMLCSPIGLGHARRDVAIAEQLREAAPRTCGSTGWPSIR